MLAVLRLDLDEVADAGALGEAGDLGGNVLALFGQGEDVLAKLDLGDGHAEAPPVLGQDDHGARPVDAGAGGVVS